MSEQFVQWRAFVGPPYKGQSEDGFWNWANEVVYQGINDPYVDEPSTTTTAYIDNTSTTVPCTDTSGLPTEGGVWVGPGNSAEAWEYILYTSNSSNTLGGLTRDAQDTEFPAAHQSGSEVKFWWELDSASGEPVISEEMAGNLTLTTATLTLEGVSAPQAALRIGHSVLFQTRAVALDTGNIASTAWRNEFFGWITYVRIRDDVAKVRTWDVTVSLIDGIAGFKHIDAVKIGTTDKQGGANAVASSTLGKNYKAFGEGEFISSEISISPSNVVQNDRNLPWISERYTGKTNTPANPGTSIDGIRPSSVACVSQFHVSNYPGQPNGYRWVEITILTNVSVFEEFLVYSKQDTTGSLTGDPYSVDYYYSFDATSLDTSYSAGDRIIIAESSALFQDENPDHGATTLIDASDLLYYKGVANTWKITKPSGSSTFQIRLDGTWDTGTISATATAEAIADALDRIDVSGDHESVGWGGPLQTADVFIAHGVDELDVIYGDSSPIEVTPGSDGDSNVTITEVIAGTGGVNQGSGEDWFDQIDPGEGSLTIKRGGSLNTFHDTQSTVRWGTMTYPPGAGDEERAGTHLWSGTPIASSGIPHGATCRYLFAPSAPSTHVDHWEVGAIHTPGYEPYAAFNNEGEWILAELNSIALELKADIDASQTSITVGNPGGDTGDGLPSTGTSTIQIGSEQMTYTTGLTRSTGVITGLTRGVNGTTATAHAAEDPVYVVDSNIATDAQLIKTVTFVRKSGLPVPEDFVLRWSPYLTVRDPNDTSGSGTYQEDYVDSASITGATVGATPGTNWIDEGDWDTFTYTFSSATRVKWMMMHVIKMTDHATQPRRAMLNEIEAGLDADVYDDSTIIADSEATEVIKDLIFDADIPAAAVQYSTGRDDIDGIVTEAGSFFPTIVDFAEFTSTRIDLDRCSNIEIKADPWWSISGTPSQDDSFDKSELIYFEPTFSSGRDVAQVELKWRTPDNATEGTEVFPATKASLGQVVTVGPYIYADSSAAQAGAQKRYYQMRRPYDALVELLGYGRTARAGKVYGINWEIDDSMQPISRTYICTAAEHRIANGLWTTALTLIQISRTDER